MKKKKKILWIIIAAVVVLGAALAVLLLTGGDDTDKEAAEAVSGEKLISLDADDMTEIRITNASGTYSLVPDENFDETAEESEYAELRAAELSGYKGYVSRLHGAALTLPELSGETVKDESAADEKYGFDASPASVTFVTKKDSETWILGGYNQAADRWYLKKEGEDTLYTTESVFAERMMQPVFYYADTTLIKDYDRMTEKALERIKGIKVERPDLAEPIELVLSDRPEVAYASSYELTSPLHIRTSQDVMENDIFGLFGFAASSVLGFYDEAKASDYGFDTPAMVMTVEHDGISEVFTFGDYSGDEQSKMRYMVSDQSDFLYAISERKLTFYTKTVEDLFFEIVLLPQIVDVKAVGLTIGDEHHDFMIEHRAEGEDDRITVTEGDHEFAEEYFRDFYELMLEIDVQRLRTEDPEGEKIMEFAYTYKDGEKDVIEVFSTSDDREMSISLNGEAQFAGRRAYIEKLTAELKHLMDNEAVDTNW